MEPLTEEPSPPDDLRCKRTNGHDWRCNLPISSPSSSFCLSHLYRPHKLPEIKPKPTLRIRVRIKPEPTDGPDQVPDHLRCHRNDGRTWRCKKQVMEGQTLCEVHFSKAKAQNQRRPGNRKRKKEVDLGLGFWNGNNLKCGKCKKRVVEGEDFCEFHLKKSGKDNVGGGGVVVALPDPSLVRPSGGSLLLQSESFLSVPPDNLRCRRNDGRDWRCKRVVMEGQSFCESHFKRIKVKDLGNGQEKKRRNVGPANSKKKMTNASNVGGGGEVVVKVENEEEKDNVLQGPVMGSPLMEEKVVKSEKGKKKKESENGKNKKKKKKKKAEVAVMEEEEFRCKRTDGRGWRCKRRVLEGKTLCELHYEQGRLRQLKITVPEELKIQRGEGSVKSEKKMKRKRDLEVLESNSDKGMKRMRAELIRVFLRREIIESTKKSEKRGEDSGEVMKDLPFGSMTIPPAPPSQILGNADSLRIKIGANNSNSLGTRRFRSKNIEPPPIGAVKNLPFPGKADKVRSSGRRKCHWCMKSDNLSLSKCSSCRKLYFCSICIKERSIDPKEVILRCPVCCGTCDCNSCCPTTQIKDTSSKEILNENFKGTKFQHLEYLINFLLPILVQINKEQGIEVEMEAKFKGQNPSDVEIRQADVGCRDQCYCNNCKSPIVDFHRSCPNCSYNLCLTCCREYPRGGSLGSTHPNKTRTLVPCQEKSSQTSVDLPSMTSLQISCPPMELGGCDNSLLDLRCIFPLNWAKELEISVKETISELNLQQIADDHGRCSLCTNIIKSGNKKKELQEVSRRKNANDNFLYCPSTLDDANYLLAHFQKHWRKGHPVKVRNVLQCASTLNWDPLTIFCGYLEKGYNNNKKTDESCSGSFDVEVGTKESFSGSSQDGFVHLCRETLKLKAKISTTFSQKLLGGNYTEVISALPLQEYTNPRMGLLNIAGKLPDDFSDSKLGPCVCMSFGSREEVRQGELVTKLCCNSYDEVSILVHVGDTTFSSEQLNKMKKLIKLNGNIDHGHTSNNDLEDDEARLPGASCCSGATMDASLVNNNQRDNKSSLTKHVNGSDTDSDASMICSRASNSPEKAVDQLPPRDNLGPLNVSDDKTPSLEPCGAQWDVFRRQDIPKLVEYISKHADEISSRDCFSNNVHPIFDGNFYLDAAHKMQLKEEFEIEPWTFNQCRGEAVFIPAGCPYQIRNFKSCVSIAVGFISPESASECIKLMNEIRVLPNNHKAKQLKLEVEKMTICSIDEAIKEIYRLMIEEGSR